MKTLFARHSFIVCLSVLMLTNCQTEPKESQPLVTERQECVLKNYTHVTDEVFPLTVAIDIPVEGPTTLLDSITDFLNENLYDFFDNYTDSIQYESLYSKDAKHLIEHYREAYAPLYFDNMAEKEFPPRSLEINLVTQTDTYVTYQANHIFIGEGVEVATDWVTFVKSDGHRLQEVISDAEMMRFCREHSGLRKDDMWSDILLNFQEGDDLSGLTGNFGLLKDSLAHQYTFAPGIYEDIMYPLDSIAPYLSQEAQELIKK